MTSFYQGQPQAPQQFAPQGYAPPAQQWGAPPAQAPQQFGHQPQDPNIQQQWGQQSAPAQEADTSDFFGGAASISWNEKAGYTRGTPRGGLILAKTKSQQSDMKTREPKFFKGGAPMMQMELTLQTSERTDPQDDGKRRMFVKADLTRAARVAFQAVGARDLEVGGWFYAAKTGEKASTDPNMSGQNLFQAVYAAPGQPDPMAGRPPYVAPQVAAPAQQAPQQFAPPAPPIQYPQGQQQWSGQPQAPQQPPAAYQQQAPGQPDPQYAAYLAQQQAAQAQLPSQQAYDAAQAQQPPAGMPQFGQQQAPAPTGGAPADYNPFAPQG